MKKIYVFLLISFLLIPIKISASCTTSTCVASSWGDNGIDKIVQRLDKSDNNIYGSYHGQNIFLMARQLSGTNVYCIKDGKTLPAKDPTKACNTETTINSNSVTNEKLRAAIGYILNYSESYKNAIFDKYDNPVEIKNSYMQTQYLIHQVLAAKNGDPDYYTGAMNTTEQNIYNGAIREFNNYKSQSVDIGNITTNINGNNYEITAAITTQKLTTNGTYTVKAGSTVLASGAIDPNATQLKISIDRSKLSSGEKLELSVLYDKEGFYLASFKSCGNGYQPITESNIERIDYPKISDSATINVNLTYTINIVHWKYVGPGNGNNGGINDCLRQTTEKLGDYTVGSTVSVPYGRAKSYDGYSLSYIGTHIGGTISYQGVPEGYTFTMPARSFQLDYVYYPNIYTVTYDANGGKDAPAPQNFTYNSEDPISKQIPTRYGYKFLNWTTRWREAPFSPGDTIPLGWGSFTLVAQWEENEGTLELEKVKQDETPLISKWVTFKIYESYWDCDSEENGEIFEFYTGGNGIGTTSLIPGSYYIREIVAPDGYGLSNECIYFEINPGETTQLTVPNKTQCEFDFENDSSISNRINMFLDDYSNFNNLLDFNIEDSLDACSVYELEYEKENSCLYSSQNTLSWFSANDLSGFNDVVQYNNNDVGFCLTEFETQEHVSLPNYPIKNGTFIISTDAYEPVITGTLTKTCYVYENITHDFYDIKTYEDYVSYVEVDNVTLGDNSSYEPLYMEYIDTEENGLHKYVGEVSVDYYFEPVYVSKISGKPCYNTSDSKCINIGYGLISEFQDGKSAQGEFNFYIGFNSLVNQNKPEMSIFDSSESTCEYEIFQEVIKYNNSDNGELELEFRTIDTNNPFNRTPKSNWNDGSNKFDSNNNIIINNYILNATNSYGLKNGQKQTPKYTITLTPDTIKEIREHNISSPYDDYKVCVDSGSNNCESNNAFINKYIKKGIIIK